MDHSLRRDWPTEADKASPCRCEIWTRMTSAFRCIPPTLVLLAIAAGVSPLARPSRGDDERKTTEAQPRQPDTPTTEATRRALIIVGLGGDEPHRVLFARLARQWQQWLVRDLGFDPANVTVLSGRDEATAKQRESIANRGSATRQSIESRAKQLASVSKPGDAAWIFVLGHAHYDEEHAHFHVPGPDFHEGDLGAMFENLKCGEQIFWLTHACSGWFLKPLSQKGRIVIAASAADREFNETEFPVALERAAQSPRAELDVNGDQHVSVAELFMKTVAIVNEIYDADMRLPTEHAQLDDNGDGAGTEADQLRESVEKPAENQPALRRIKRPDGPLALGTYLPLPVPAPKPDSKDPGDKADNPP